MKTTSKLHLTTQATYNTYGKQYHKQERENLEKMLTFANGAASLITTKKGALRVMPEKEEVKDFIKKFKK